MNSRKPRFNSEESLVVLLVHFAHKGDNDTFQALVDDAIASGYEATIRTLTEMTTTQKMPAMEVACRDNRLVLACMLLSFEHEWPSTFFFACKHGSLAIMEYTYPFVYPNMESTEGITPFHAACVNGHTHIVTRLIELGVKKETRAAQTGHSPLHAACISGHMDIVRILCEGDHCSPYTRDLYGYLPVVYAAFCGHTRIVEYLVSGCPDLLAHIEPEGRTLAECASMNNHKDTANAILAMHTPSFLGLW